MADGRAEAGAAKVVLFEGDRVKHVHGELEALRAVQDNPYLVHCLAVFEALHGDGHRYATIVTRSDPQSLTAMSQN